MPVAIEYVSFRLAEVMQRILVTGGAGFIGSHLVDKLIDQEKQVTILDSLEEQVHGTGRKAPDYLSKKAKLVVGDICDRDLLSSLISEADAVVHLAAMVGVGQSMYQIDRYVNVNTRGTGTLLDVLVNGRTKAKKLVVASSMSVYGEGKYTCSNCRTIIYPDQRDEAQLASKKWDPQCPTCGRALLHQPTDEQAILKPTSIYAMTKRHQEEMCLLTGQSYGIPTTALRFFNAYGPRQALSNPYTGVCAIFTSRILNEKSPFIFEDGNQLRDFIHVTDVADAIVLALEREEANYKALNVGTGKTVSILEIARILIDSLNPNLQPEISGDFRKGDIRHCYPDMNSAEKLLGFRARIALKEGLAELSEWAKEHGWGSSDQFDKALGELKKRKLA